MYVYSLGIFSSPHSKGLVHTVALLPVGEVHVARGHLLSWYSVEASWHNLFQDIVEGREKYGWRRERWESQKLLQNWLRVVIYVLLLGGKAGGKARRRLQVHVLPVTENVLIPLWERQQLSSPTQGTLKILTAGICLLTSVEWWWWEPQFLQFVRLLGPL